MSRARLERWLTRRWYGAGAPLALRPLAGLYCAVSGLRRRLYRRHLLPVRWLDSRVVVVGSIAVAGSGKTPLVIALARRLRAAGLEVGILTRGYGGRSLRPPRPVLPDSDPFELGDEAVLLARRSGAPVVAGADRHAAGRLLLSQHACDVVLCDDGLQHYALGRDLEIALVDAAAEGNGRCLPAGPLREPRSRLSGVDALIGVGDAHPQGWSMQLQTGRPWCLQDSRQRRSLAEFCGERVHAVAGIARPQRFFEQLRQAGLEIEIHAFGDHHAFAAADLAFGDRRPVLMTEKDAVKCERFAQPHWWCVPVAARPDAAFEDWLLAQLKQDT
ncbi:MAG TPA: tetraacyldisaccharide 4'-kinase [Gammaproteobacteria bacterium]|nr:tetraacyldisaccharide 4'-kinase [Gammaproteobacteria bacterium]